MHLLEDYSLAIDYSSVMFVTQQYGPFCLCRSFAGAVHLLRLSFDC